MPLVFGVVSCHRESATRRAGWDSTTEWYERAVTGRLLKNLLLIPLLILIAAAAGLGICRAAGWNPHLRELTVALVIGTVSGMVALVPAMLARTSGVAAVSQSGLFGTIIHMFLAILLSAVAWVAKLAGEHKPYLFWLLMFYWVSLVAVVMTLASVVRQVARQQGSGSMVVTGQRATPKPTAVHRSA